ncbi:MAG: pyridoxal-phosphate dependent enzyme [Solirubrobacterales bacterium]|nr:pyridoxal-phosphate dependent enzyme [Solirubrobacterales bacterium]
MSPSPDGASGSPAGVGPAEVEAAAERIGGRVRETPVIALEPGALGVDAELTLKLELLQHTGSFKPRGAFSAMLAADVPAAGVYAASGGNFALAVAHAAARLGHPATIFVPEASPPAKVERLRRGTCEVVVVGALYDDALAVCSERAARAGGLELHAFDDPLVVAGQGTCARELDRQAPGLDTVLVAVGGGGLAGGTCAWYTDRARIVAVEPERAPTLARARAAGAPVEVEVGGLAADSLGARRIGAHPWRALEAWADESVLVSDESIRAAQRLLWDQVRVAAEPGGATALAALLSGAYAPAAGERVGVLVCGANLDPSVLA